MSALLINPPVHDFAAFDLWSKPLGLLYVAAGLQARGYSVVLLDCMDRCDPDLAALAKDKRGLARQFGTGHFYREDLPKPSALAAVPRRYRRYGMPPGLLARRLASMPEPELVLVGSLMTYWYPGVQEAIALVRGQWPRVPVALGGIYATLCPEHAKRTSGADSVVPGPGLEGAIRLARRFVRSPRTEALPPPQIADLRPAYGLYPRMETAAALTSTGCPFACTYCAASVLQPQFAQRDVADVADEIAAYVSRGVRDIAFYDDALLVNAESHFLPLARRLEGMSAKARYHTPNGLHPRFVTPEVATAMKAAGFVTLRLSLESADERWQQRSSRKVTTSEFALAAEHLLRAGFEPEDIAAYLLVGCPGQTADDVARSICLVRDIGVGVKLAEYSPIPGTVDFGEAVRRLPGIAQEPLLQNNTVYSLLAGDLTAKQLEDLKQLARGHR